MTGDFQTQVEVIRDKAVEKLRKWGRDQAAKEVQREYLSEQGLIVKSGTKLEELLDERHRIALGSPDPEVRLKAINASLEMAAGSEKVTNVQNNQYNFGKFLDNIKI